MNNIYKIILLTGLGVLFGIGITKIPVRAQTQNVIVKNVSGVLTQTDFPSEDTVYEIEDEFSLGGADITIPSGCSLQFNGGSISDGSIDGNGCSVEGTYSSLLCGIYHISNEEIDAEMFRDDAAGDDSLWIQRALDAGSSMVRGCEVTDAASTIIVPSGIIMDGFSFDCSQNPNAFIILTPAQDSVGTIIRNCNFTGNGKNEGQSQSGWAMSSGHNMRDILIEDCSFTELNIAVSFNAENGGDIYDCRVMRCNISNIRGTKPGQGYGIHDNQGHNTLVEDCVFDNCERHCVYFADSYSPTLRDCKILNHRKSIGYNGEDRSALQIARRTCNVVVENNEFSNCFCAAIQISAGLDETAIGMGYGSNYNIRNNSFTCNNDTIMASFIMIGGESMMEGDEIRGSGEIEITGNSFSSVKNDQVMIIWQGRDSLLFAENTIHVSPGQVQVFELYRLSRGVIDAPFVEFDNNHFTSDEEVSIGPALVKCYTSSANNGYRWGSNTVDSQISIERYNIDTSSDYTTVIY